MHCNGQVEVEYVDMAPPAGVLWPHEDLQRASLLQSKYAATLLTSEKFNYVILLVTPTTVISQ